MNDAFDQRPLLIYVEDDPDTFRLAELRLRSKYRVLGAASDREACLLFRRHAKELYAVLMDIELAGSQLDGVQLVRLLRGTPATPTLPDYAHKVPVMARLPIIVMTAYSARYTENEVKAVGATHYVAKPIDFTRLTLALAQANIASVMHRLAGGKSDLQPALNPSLLDRRS